MNLYETLNDLVSQLYEDSVKTRLSSASSANFIHYSQLTSDVHVLPYFHGNRSPRADPSLTGIITGFTLHSHTLQHLTLLYLATIQALACGTRHILEVMKQRGITVKYLFLCGGLSKNKLFVQQHAGRNTIYT